MLNSNNLEYNDVDDVDEFSDHDDLDSQDNNNVCLLTFTIFLVTKQCCANY